MVQETHFYRKILKNNLVFSPFTVFMDFLMFVTILKAKILFFKDAGTFQIFCNTKAIG